MRSFIIPDIVKQVSRKLRSSGFGGLSMRHSQLAGNYLARSANVLGDSSLVAWFDANYGVTQSGGLVSRWENLSLNRPTYSSDLLQATSANQPTYLGWGGVNYLWLPGVVGNYASAPDSAVLSITGNIDLRCFVALSDWTPTSNQILLAKWMRTGNQRSYQLAISTSGNITFTYSADGTASVVATSTIAVTVSDFSALWVRATRNSTSGDVQFFTSSNGVNWVQLGTTVAGSSIAMFSGTSIVEIGSETVGTLGNSLGRVYRAQIYNGINGTVVFDADFTSVPNGATSFTESSSNGATVTINSTGALPAQVVGQSSLLFDGTNDYLKMPAFTLNQPESVYLVAKQVTSTLSDRIFDGGIGGAPMGFIQLTTTGLRMTAGNVSFLDVVSSSVGTTIAFALQYSGANSSLRINRGSTTTGNVGSANASGFTLGADAGSSSFGNFQVYEILIFNTAHSTSVQNTIIQYLGEKWGIAV